jgi:hypothetical protein
MDIHDNRQPPGPERVLDPLVKAETSAWAYGPTAAVLVALVVLTPAWIVFLGWLVLSLFLWLLG